MDKDITAALDSINEVNPYATYLNNNTLSTVSEWIDTGSYVLNSIISGSRNGGIPKGRVTMIAVIVGFICISYNRFCKFQANKSNKSLFTCSLGL